ncbi:MAG: FeoA family protein [Flavobacteriaceae bacterium]|nr:FeoA family protein [Flavobacteriaceae bacterium]
MKEKPQNIKRLCDFPNGIKGKILEFDNEEFQMPNKIIEMGLLPDTEFVVLHRAPLGGPMYVEYGIEKTKVALRAEEAKFILVETIK